ncbi:protein unc-93 homolog A isoform X4 [Myotis yumanensis]|uniref:protein unc-93 homolog A isoform X4 n=1 Tax=Myotis yumanensis TaxID=159337 RepID=UPI0038D1C1E2
MRENLGSAASCTPHTGDGACNPGLCPDPNRTVTSWVIGRCSAPEPYQPGWISPLVCSLGSWLSPSTTGEALALPFTPANAPEPGKGRLRPRPGSDGSGDGPPAHSTAQPRAGQASSPQRGRGGRGTSRPCFPDRYTLIPTSILLGLGAAPLWSAQCTYLTIAGNSHAAQAGKAGLDVVNHYFGIFFLIFQSSGVWGNLISSLVFGQMPTQGAITEEQLRSCGANDCLMATAPGNSTQRPSQELIYTLLGIYTGSGVLAILLVALFLDPIREAPDKSEGETPSVLSTLLSTFKLFRDKRLRLLMLLPMYSGFEQAFLAGDYTRSSSASCSPSTRRPPSPTTACGRPWASCSPSATARSCASTSSSTSCWPC